MIGRRNVVVSFLVSALLVALVGLPCAAQQAAATDIWRLAPSNSILIAVNDGRADNPSIKALAAVADPQTLELRAKQHADLRKAIENLATLFGISLDFAKDIDSWADRQLALVILPDEKAGPSPVFMVASKDAAAANAALQKIAAPWQRVGELASETESDCPITVFRTKKQGAEVYASGCGTLAAFSTSKASLMQVLKGGGMAAGSPGEKVLNALAGSMLYAYADPAVLKMMKAKAKGFPLAGFGLGVYAVETGMKIRVLGLPDEAGAALLKQAFPPQMASAPVANDGIPGSSLVSASLPSIKGFVAMARVFGMSKSPVFGIAQAVSDTQVSAAMTAALPMPAGVASAMASSDQAATDGLAEITASLRQLKITTEPATAGGIPATIISMSHGRSLYLAQAGKHLLLATDTLSLGQAAAAVKGDQPNLAQSTVYKETIAGLGDSNILTVYANLAPLQGLGFLIDGTGLGHLQPLIGAVAKGLENMQALGIGAGFDGELASATLFLRARPGIGAGTAIAGTAITAAIVFPVFARARYAARAATCQNNLKQLATAALMYADAHQGKLPTSAMWQTQLKPYLKAPTSDLKCPSRKSTYAFNKSLSGVSVSKIMNPARVVLFFEAHEGLQNASGGREDAMLPHNGGINIAFADGHVMRMSELPGRPQWAPFAPAKPIKKAPAGKVPVRGKR